MAPTCSRQRGLSNGPRHFCKNLLLLRRDKVYGVADGADTFGFFIADLDPELVF